MDENISGGNFPGGIFLTTAFLLKTIIWTWILLQVLQSALLKNETKSSQKRWNPPKNFLS